MPIAMDGVAFLHPMNGNVLKVDDLDYDLDIAYGFTLLEIGATDVRIALLRTLARGLRHAQSR